nr:pyridoxal-phosphate dependent enzyme [Bradyrhizobium sp. 188]
MRHPVGSLLDRHRRTRQRRIVTASTGNHGRAVAYAARIAGIEAVVCLFALVPENKVNAVRRAIRIPEWGADRVSRFCAASAIRL